MVKKTDRRVERTKQSLREALFSLIREKGFEDISVQEIIDRANVGRATFYAHFDNKEDLLISGFDGFRAQLRKCQRDAFAKGKTLDDQVFSFSQEVFAHVNDYREVFRAMVGKRSGAIVEGILHRLLIELVRNDVKGAVPSAPMLIPQSEGLVQFLAGGLFGMIGWWINGKSRLSVDEVNALFRQLAIPAIIAGKGQGVLSR